MCFRRLSVFLYNCSQMTHLKGPANSPCMFFSCVRRWSLRENFFMHWPHWYLLVCCCCASCGFSCLPKFKDSINSFTSTIVGAKRYFALLYPIISSMVVNAKSEIKIECVLLIFNVHKYISSSIWSRPKKQFTSKLKSNDFIFSLDFDIFFIYT